MSAKPERLMALLRANQYLLTKIKEKKRNLARLDEKLSAAAATVGQLAPVVQEMEQLDREVHAMFAALLSRKRQPRGIVRAVKDMYLTLQQLGVLSWRSPEPEGKGAEAEGGESIPDSGEYDEPRHPADGEGGVSATRPGEGAVGQTVRSLFRKLAEALHPDKVQKEAEKERRTEAMKEITRAYQDGDLARLLELERTYLVSGDGGELSPESDELNRRCATLERTNEALRAQLDQVTSELKELRRSPQAALLSQFTSSTKGNRMTPAEQMVADAKAQLGHLRELVVFVTSFREGQIDLAEFLQGPSFLRDQREAEDELMRLLLDQRQWPRRGKKRRTTSGTHRPGDCPF